MLFVWRPLSTWTFPENTFSSDELESSQAPTATNAVVNGSSFGRNTQDYLKHPLEIQNLTRYSTEVFKVLCVLAAIISKASLQRFSDWIFSRVLCHRNRRVNKNTSNSDYRNCVALNPCQRLFLPHRFYFNSFRKRRGWVFFQVCFLVFFLVLRPTAIPETKEFVMDYCFSSVFLLCFTH